MCMYIIEKQWLTCCTQIMEDTPASEWAFQGRRWGIPLYPCSFVCRWCGRHWSQRPGTHYGVAVLPSGHLTPTLEEAVPGVQATRQGEPQRNQQLLSTDCHATELLRDIEGFMYRPIYLDQWVVGKSYLYMYEYYIHSYAWYYLAI